ncbi:MAG: hypothetical protein JWN52_6813 [Actinomycetia bacterium]|nr:hypothetical protein [Actinomycetes bacterium]
MPMVPPTVTSRLADTEGPAYLLAWIRIPDGTWVSASPELNQVGGLSSTDMNRGWGRRAG